MPFLSLSRNICTFKHKPRLCLPNSLRLYFSVCFYDIIKAYFSVCFYDTWRNIHWLIILVRLRFASFTVKFIFLQILKILEGLRREPLHKWGISSSTVGLVIGESRANAIAGNPTAPLKLVPPWNLTSDENAYQYGSEVY